MSKHFNTKESYQKKLIKQKLKARYSHRLAREKLERELKPLAQEKADISALAEHLSYLAKFG